MVLTPLALVAGGFLVQYRFFFGMRRRFASPSRANITGLELTGYMAPDFQRITV